MNSETSINKNSIESWSEYFITRGNAPFIDKSHKSKLFQTFKATITKEECKKQMIKQNEIAFLFQMNFGQGKINLIHHCQEIG